MTPAAEVWDLRRLWMGWGLGPGGARVNEGRPMSANVRFKVQLDCLQCGAHNAPGEAKLHTSGLNDIGLDRWVSPGDSLPIVLADFEDAYLTLHKPETRTIFALEQWTCAHCKFAQWTELTF